MLVLLSGVNVCRSTNTVKSSVVTIFWCAWYAHMTAYLFKQPEG